MGRGKIRRLRPVASCGLASDADARLTGGCNCGVVRYEVDGPLAAAGYCHCTRCQRRSGTAASVNARPTRGALRILAGEDRLRAWRPQDGWEKVFCGDCGSHILSRDPDDHGAAAIRMGTFDRDPGIRPTFRQFVAYAAPWEPIPDDGLPRYSEGAPRP